MSTGIPLKKRTAVKIAVAYALAAGLWILFSDRLIAALFGNIPTLMKISALKGWFFVGVTSVLLYFFIQRGIGSIQHSEKGLKESVTEAIVASPQKAESDLLRAQKLESIGVLARGFSHDFNNLLTGILGNISLAKTSLRTEDRLFGLLTKAEDACLRAELLTNQLHDIAKSSESKKKDVSISDLIKESAAFALRSSAIKCTYNVSDELWPVMADEGQIGQAIYNIVANACDVMGDKGNIKISAENAVIGPDNSYMLKQGNYIKLSIEDEGAVIGKELLPKTFNPFSNTKESGSDTGARLSLAASYFAVKNHQGYIFAESAVGEGTNFYIYLPSA